MLVFKFGGTSVGDATRIFHVAKIIKDHSKEEIVVVVSAMSGVTDLLLNTARKATEGETDIINENIQKIRSKHYEVIEHAIKNPDLKEKTFADVNNLLNDLIKLIYSVGILGEITPRSNDYIASFGEKLSSIIVSRVLTDCGTPSENLSAENFIITDDVFMNATPFMEMSKKKIVEKIVPLLKKGIVPVVTGFIGATEKGITTTLGRGGSDYTGTIIGTALNAREIWIWTDVDGIMSADPRILPEAKTIDAISYAEAAELAYFGGKVIHPKTILPAIEKKIPVRIKNTFNPKHPGTLIIDIVEGQNKKVKAITSISNLGLVSVAGSGMIGIPGVAARAFLCIAKLKVNVLMISQSSSEQNISIVIEDDKSENVVSELKKEFELELLRKNIDNISSKKDICIVAAIGEGMKSTPGIAGEIFSALGDEKISITAIAQGASELNISFVIEKKDLEKTVKGIHKRLNLGK